MLHKSFLCLIFLWITPVDASANYIISNESITCHEAKSKGNIATPKIQVDNSSFTMETIKIIGNEEAWVGYYKKETAFAYIGCGLINNAHPEVTLPVSRNSPGLCYSMCKTTERNYIGLNKGKCFCMSEKRNGNIYLPECDITPTGTWLAGGGDKYMSIYERINIDMDVRNSQEDEKCLAFEYINNNVHIMWSGCQYSYLALCKKEVSNYISQNDVIKCGYVTKLENITVLSFTENIYNKRRFLLHKGPSTKLTTERILTPSTNVITNLPMGTSSSDWTVFTSTINNTLMNSSEGMGELHDSGVIIAVSVSVVVTALLVAAVIIIIYLQRRGKLPCNCIIGSALDKCSHVNTIHDTSHGTAYNQTGEVHVYRNLEGRQDLGQDNGYNAYTYCSLEHTTMDSHTYDSLGSRKK